MTRAALLVAVLLSPAVAGGCSSRTTTTSWQSPPPPTPLTLAVTPSDHATKVPVSTEIGFKVTGGKIDSITMAKAGSADSVRGAMRDDGTSWIPAAPLEYQTKYTATVHASSPDGTQTSQRDSTFTTMSKPSRTTETGMNLQSGETYGVAMPIVLEFDPPVPAAARASVQRRLFVRSKPDQPGVWRWMNGNQLYYRPPMYWQTGTVITMRAALGGLPMGGGRFGDNDRSATVKIGGKFAMEVDNRTKKISVYVNNKLAKRFPVSLGKASTPSSSGRLVVMSRAYSTIFDTTNEGPGGYRVQVNFAERLTWGGEFIHAAPWSVGDQGRRNVSHGCVNVSYSNAKWIYDRVHVGDPVTVRNTEVKVGAGNGWTAWDEPWSKYVKGSALPVPTSLVQARDQFAPTPKPTPHTTPHTTETPTAPGPTPTPTTGELARPTAVSSSGP